MALRKIQDVGTRPIRDHGQLDNLEDDTHPQYRGFAPLYQSGRYYTGAIGGDATSTTFQPSKNVIYFSPFFVRREITIDEVAVLVDTPSGASQEGHIGFYASDETTQLPSTYLYNSPSFLTDATGLVSFSLSLTLSPGLYYTAFCSEASDEIFKAQQSDTALCLFGNDDPNAFFRNQSFVIGPDVDGASGFGTDSGAREFLDLTPTHFVMFRIG